MLSVVVYGRNDSYGYSLQKRATLSLNAIAHVLDDPDDEIIFVDYNTPDEVPTFPEVIADTLTQQARERLRIIRVRPAYHAQFNGKTGLVALEPQSRNIAARRANPANRWVLSTNTDMIFVPSERDRSLSGVCADLADAFYHLPRFELPEGFWERADRSDPAAMIEAMRQLGRRYHLNEIVYGGYDNIYEGPGDFQLFLRDDLFKIAGFDERMLLGWHADTNMARRMRLLRGKVDTAFPALSGYHCGHTRQATSLHGSRRTENCIATFVRDVQDARWIDGDDWGAPDQTFEEFRLSDDRRSVFLSAVDRAVPESGPDLLEATFNEGTYGEQGYEPMHVLPHLADVLFNLEAGQSIFVVGSDEALLDGLARFVAAPSLSMRIVLCSESNSPGPDARLSAEHAFAPLDAGLAEANIVLLQYPNAATVDRTARADLQWYVQYALEKFIELERAKPAHQRRRIVIVNGTHNPLQDIIHGSIDVATMPYSSRIRHGRVGDPPASLYPAIGPADSLDGAFYAHLGRTRGYSETDLEQIRRAIAREPGWERMAIELSALSEHAIWAAGFTGTSADILKQLGASAKECISSAMNAAPAVTNIQTPRTGAANRLCSGADWEDPAWRALAERYFGQRIYALSERSRWVWERITLLHELTRRLPPGERPWVLVLSNGPDTLPALLSHLGYRVAYESIDPDAVAAAEWEFAFRIGGLVLPASLLPLSEAPEGIAFEAVLAPGSVLFTRGREHFEATLARFAPRVAKDAHFGASTLVHLNGSKGGGALSSAEFAGAFSRSSWLAANGLHGDEPIDARIPLDTLLRYAGNDYANGGVPGLSFGFDPSVQVTVGVLWARFGDAARFPSTSLEALSPPSDTMIAFAAAMRAKTIIHANLFTHTPRNLLPFALSEEGSSFQLAFPITRINGGVEVELELDRDASAGAIHGFIVTDDNTVLMGSALSGQHLTRISFAPAREHSRGILVVFADGATPNVRAIRARACASEAAESVA